MFITTKRPQFIALLLEFSAGFINLSSANLDIDSPGTQGLTGEISGLAENAFSEWKTRAGIVKAYL